MDPVEAFGTLEALGGHLDVASDEAGTTLKFDIPLTALQGQVDQHLR